MHELAQVVSCPLLSYANLSHLLASRASFLLSRQGVGHSSFLIIKTEIVGTHFEHKSWLPVSVLISTIGSCRTGCWAKKEGC